MDRTKEYYFVLSTMPRLHARSRLLELGVLGVKVQGKVTHKWVREGGGTRVLNIFYYILLTIFVLFWLGVHLG